MEQINIICNQCGTALQIAEYDTYATCPNCTTHLKIIEDKHTISTIIVEQRGKNRKPPKLIKTEQDTTLADLNKELEALDSAWQTSVLLFNRKQKQTKTAKFEWEAISTIFLLAVFFNLKLQLSYFSKHV